MDYLYTNDVIVIGLKLLGRGKNYDWKTQLSVAFFELRNQFQFKFGWEKEKMKTTYI